MLDGLSLTSIKAALQPFGIETAALDAIAAVILLHATEVPTAATASHTINIGDIARVLHRNSIKRHEFIGKAADDLAWNMLLAIFADQTDGREVSVSSACFASGGAPTTALRQLTALSNSGHIVREPDPLDRRRANVSLAPWAYGRMATLIASFCIPPPTATASAPFRRSAA